MREGYAVRTVRLTPVPSVGSGRYGATLSDLNSGQYELRLTTGDDFVPPPRLIVRVAQGSAGVANRELTDLSGDERTLRQIADSTGGQYLTLDQITTLPARLATLRERHQYEQSATSEYPLWNSPYLFLFVLSGLSLEWALRKRIGLA